MNSRAMIGAARPGGSPAVELILREFERAQLYGEVVIKYEAGRVVLIRKTESIKPAEYRHDDGDHEH